MSPIPNIPAGGGADDFSQRIAAERAKIAGQQPGAQRTAEQAARQAQKQSGGPSEPAPTQSGAQGEPAPAQEEDQNTGPVGQGDYVVKRGDCISSIAKNTGHFWETIWNDSANAELKEVRKDPNVLLPGDRVTIPEIEQREEDCATTQRHRFRRLGEPAKLKLRVMKEPDQEAEEEAESEEETQASPARPREQESQEDEPRANLPYTLEIDGQTFSGQTDEEGYLEHPIPGNARRGKLVLEPGTANEVSIPVQLGALDPLTETRGVKQRLNNLAFDCGDETDEPTPQFEAALKAFQEKHGLEATGRPDQETRDKLQEVHGS